MRPPEAAADYWIWNLTEIGCEARIQGINMVLSQLTQQHWPCMRS